MRLEELEPLVVEWATNKGLLTNPNPKGQMGKTLEEIQEATEAMPSGYDAREFGSEAHINAATELGDILVTLVVQAKIQGLSLSQLVKEGFVANAPPTWEKVSVWAKYLESAVRRNAFRRNIPSCPSKGIFAGVYCCVADAAQTRLARLPEECLELAWQKIKNRTGETVDGVFVRDREVAEV